MALYKLINDPDDNSKTINIKKDLGNNTYLFIPFVPGNSDYDEYLEWKAAGNTPEAAD